MAQWQTIQNFLTNIFQPLRTRLDVEKLFKASESPTAFGVIAGLGIIGLIFLNIPNSVSEPPNDIEENTANILMQSTDETQAADKLSPVEDNSPAFKTKTYMLKRSETLLGLLKRAGIGTQNAHNAINELKAITDLRKLRAGQKVVIETEGQNTRKIYTLSIRDTFAETATVRARENTYEAKRIAIDIVPVTHLVSGVINDNLYLSAKRAGLPDKIIVDLIRLMSFDVDFEREIRVGDSFEIYYERKYAPHYDDIENTRIISANIGLQKRTLNAIYFQEENGDEGYYDLKGESTKRALMKTPLDVAVVTSSYGRRKHPVLGYTRLHKGTDFRAPTGTPIMAAGDGIIEMSARNGSYGNYIRIRHNGSYKTAYAHLSRYGRGIKKGRRVKQGQIIGYSGATGRVTGAHLHYEVLYNGKQVNPLRLKLPTGKSLKGKNLTGFKETHALIAQEIEHARLMNSLHATNTHTVTP